MKKVKEFIKSLSGYNTHLFFVILIVVGMPLSKFLMSLGTLALVAHWFLEGDVLNKFRLFFKSKIAVISTLTFIIFLIGLIYTSNFEYGFKDIRLKVPLLAFPVIFSSSHKLTKKHFKVVLLFFAGAVLISTLYGYLAYVKWLPSKKEIIDIRDVSQFISHIRLSLMIVLSMFLLPFLLKKTWLHRAIMLIVLLWFAYFLSLIESVTGFVVGCTTLIFMSIYLAFIKKSLITIIPAILTVALIVFLSIKLYVTYNKVKIDETSLKEYTELGEKYKHTGNYVMFDNGNYSQHYMAKNEFEKAWAERSNLYLYGLDGKGFGLMFTATRYLTSKGYKKDYKGVYKLTKTDIKNIENGIPNYLYASNDLMSRLYLIMFETNGFLEGANVNGNSFAQRLVYWKMSKEIAQNNFWFGCGTGDVGDVFIEGYKERNSLAEKFQLRSHNQYLSAFIALGFFGVVIFIFTLIVPLQFAIKKRNYFYILFSCIALVSFLSEDTLETQDGVFFFAFFNSLFLFSNPNALKFRITKK